MGSLPTNPVTNPQGILEDRERKAGLRFIDGGEVLRQGNAYSGGNVSGQISVNGGAPAGTMSSASPIAPHVAPAPAAAPAIAPAAPAIAPVVPAAAPAPIDSFTARNNAVSGTSIAAPGGRFAPPPSPAAAPAAAPDLAPARDPSRGVLHFAQGGSLRTGHGGHVPGSGEGDKIPAKYEPGEFVVSNDMLDDNPGVREELSAMREQTLAARGKSVEEADAHATRLMGQGQGLRAAGGYDPLDRMARGLTGQNQLPPRSVMGNMAENLRAGVQPPPVAPVAPVAPAGPVNPSFVTATSPERAAWERMRAGQPQNAPVAGTSAGASAGASAGPSGLRNTWDNFTGRAANNFVGPQAKPSNWARAGSALGTTAGVAGALYQEGPGVYKVAADPNSSGIDVATQVAGAGGKLAAGVLGGKAGAMAGGALGAFGGPAGALIGAGIGGVAGGAAGYFGADKLIEGGRALAGSDTRDPAEQIAAGPSLRPTAPAAKQPVAANPHADANAAKIAAAGAQAQDPGLVTRDGNSYSGRNVSGNISINGFDPMGGGISDQNMRAADNLQAAQSLRGTYGAGGQAPQFTQVPMTRHSGNDWQSRKDLENAATAASSITADGGRFDSRRGNTSIGWREQQALPPSAKQAVYGAMLQNDLELKRGNDPQALAAIQARSSEMNSERAAGASRHASDNSLRGSMYGADQSLRGSMLSSQSARGKLLYDMQKDARQEARDQETHVQKTGNYAQKNAREDLRAFDPATGKEDEGKSAARFDVANQLFPGFAQMDEPSRTALGPDVKEMMGIFDRTYDRKQMGLDKINPFDRRGDNRSSMPNFAGGKLEKQGALGYITPGGEAGGYYVSKDGTDVPLGKLTARQVELIQRQIETGSWTGKKEGK